MHEDPNHRAVVRGARRRRPRHRNGVGEREAGLAAEQCDLDDGVREPDLGRRAHARPRRPPLRAAAGRRRRLLDRPGRLRGRRESSRSRRRQDEPALQSGRARIRARRPALPDRLRCGRRRDRRRHSERRQPGEPTRRDRLRNGDARGQRRRLRRRRQPVRVRRRHRPGTRLPRRPGGRRGDGALPRSHDGQHGRRRPPEPELAAAASAGDPGDRRERLGVRQGRRAPHRRHRPGRAVASRPEQERRRPDADRLRHDVRRRHALPRRALRAASGSGRRRRDRARPCRQRLGRPERAELVVVVDRRGGVTEYFRNPVGAGSLRNGGPLEFPTSPVLAGRTFCTTSSDGNRRDNSPNTAGEAQPGSAVVGKVSCLDHRLGSPGEPLPVG